jgi:hypothetical protein
MKDLIGKLTELEATAPKKSVKKMLKEDSTTPPINVSNKPASLKDIFETMVSGQAIPVVGKMGDTQQTGAGFLNMTDTSPAAQALGKAVGDLVGQKKLQIVVPNQPGQAKPGQPAPAGATGQPQAGQMQMKEKWDAETKVAPSEKGKYDGKTKAELTSQYNKLKASGPHKKGSPAFGKMRELAFAIRAKSDWGKVQEEKLDELSPELMKRYAHGRMDQLSNVAQGYDMRTTGHTNPKTPVTKDKISGYYDKQAGDIERERYAAQQQSTDAAGQAKSARMSQDLDSQAAFNAQRKHKALKGHDSLVKTVGKLRDTGAIKDKKLDELSQEKIHSYIDKAVNSKAQASNDIGAHRGAMAGRTGRYIPGDNSPAAKQKADAGKATYDKRNRGIDMAINNLVKKVPANEGAKVDRMVKHIEKSERGLGKSKDKASDIAWATANKRGMLDNKNKKKVKEGDIAPTNGIDTRGAGLGAGRSATTLEGKEPQVEVIDNAFNRENYKDLIGKKYPKSKAPAYARVKEISEGKKPDFLDLDKDGDKKESMKKAAADKKKKVKESMNHRISAARLEGKSHGLRGHAHSGKRYEDMSEMKAYHEGYKEGLDECYGQGVYETAPAMPAATVPGMASAAMPTMEDDMEEGKLGKAALALGGAAALATGAGIGKNVYDYHKTDAATGYSQADVDKMMGTDSRRSAYDREQERRGNYRFEEDEMEEGNAFTAALAKTPKGGKFAVGGKTFTDRTGYDAKVNEYAFESWDNQLNDLLNEGAEVNEGLSVSISKGQQNSPDSVTITAQDQEADELLAFVKQAGLGLFGADKEPSSAMSVQPSHGAPNEIGAGGVDVEVVDGHDGIMGLMQKLSGIQSAGQHDADYADEEEHTCNECGGMMEAGHDHTCNNCSDSSENNAIVDEFLDVTVAQKGMGGDSGSSSGVAGVSSTGGQSGATGGYSNANAQSGSAADADAAARVDAKSTSNESESEDQMEFEVAEDNAPDSETAEHNADEEAEAEEDMALAKADQQNKTTTVNEGGDGGEASEEGPESKEGETDEEGETVSESFINLFKKLAFIAEESTAEKDDKAEKAAKKVAKDIEYDEGHKGKDDNKAEKAGEKVKKDIEYDDKKDKKEKVDEWANNAGPGKTVSDTTFEQDIDFMTKVIAGGLNKPKSTGQTTIPVIAGQEDRIHDESTNTPANFAKLAGIK